MDLGTAILAITLAAVLGLCIGLAVNGLGYQLGRMAERRRQQKQARQDMDDAVALVTPAGVR